MKLFLISENIDTLTGMRLAGVEGVIAHEREELKEELAKAYEMPDVGIVIVTEKLGRVFPDLLMEAREKSSLPLLIEIPDRHGSLRGENFITAYVNDAIGVKL